MNSNEGVMNAYLTQLIRELLISYGGQWFGQNYEGGDSKIVFVPPDLTYHWLMNRIEDILRIDSTTFNIELRAVMTTSGRRAIPRIKNDRDVAFLMSEERVIPEVYVTNVGRYERAGGSMQTETEMQAQIPPNIVLQQGFPLLAQPFAH
ncbi:hypothetical protein Ddye_021157 [Dipteronia dyeriana]|uniref:Uncharacterized protein n=1 Tax=Dipteronia dyeriana TaxID=168575 RepID=A0AAD9WXG2_9ROSI|nr:hypothetical protein Ddye_021157 [Dipteronia dyeriana]